MSRISRKDFLGLGALLAGIVLEVAGIALEHHEQNKTPSSPHS